MINIQAIEDEIVAGLQENVRKRLDEARVNHDFYLGNFGPYSPRDVGRDYEAPRYIRTSLIMYRIVQVLTQHLYARGPSRTLTDAPEATEWLQAEYARLGVDGLLQEADRLSTVGDVCAIQIAGTGDPESPIRILLWPAHQFHVWESDEDPTVADAVATIDYTDERRRLRLWTADEVRTYETDKLMPGQTAGGTAYRLVDTELHDYGLPPFAFVHFNQPSTQFWSGGLGDNLRVLNDYMNSFLTEAGDNLRYAGKQITVMFGVSEAWNPPKPIKPADIWKVPPAYLDEGGNGIPPDIKPLETNDAGIEVGWNDAQSYIDHSLECYGIPPSTIRMVQTSAKSGAAIVGEQLPLIIYAMGRQRPFGSYEKQLARVSLAVGRAESARMGRPVASLDPRLADGLALRWPSLVPELPLYGAAQDQADQWALACGLTSRIQVTMRKFNMTRDEALAHLRDVAKDLEEEATLGLPALPTNDPSTGGMIDAQQD